MKRCRVLKSIGGFQKGDVVAHTTYLLNVSELPEYFEEVKEATFKLGDIFEIHGVKYILANVGFNLFNLINLVTGSRWVESFEGEGSALFLKREILFMEAPEAIYIGRNDGSI